MKRLWALLLTTGVLFTAHGAAIAESGTKYSLDLLLSGGTSILNIDNPSFGAKMVPVAGLGIAPYFSKGDLLSYGFELLLQYSMKSNYNDYFYYDSYFSISFIPCIRVHIKRRGTRNVSYYLCAGLGGTRSFSGFTHRTFFLSSLSGGVVFDNFFVDAILLDYTHAFLRAYRAHETVRLEAVFTLSKKKLQRLPEGGKSR